MTKQEESWNHRLSIRVRDSTGHAVVSICPTLLLPPVSATDGATEGAGAGAGAGAFLLFVSSFVSALLLSFSLSAPVPVPVPVRL